jgi:anti-sigma regulatory factor (Ser/Thr protein kinase)
VLERAFELQVTMDDPAGVGTARRAATGIVVQWDVRPSVADDACLVVSELVTNAVRHGRSDVVLRLKHYDGFLRVEVVDEDTRLPVLVAPDPQSLSGRGLGIVASLATSWGAERTAGGKIVWAEFDVSERREG